MSCYVLDSWSAGRDLVTVHGMRTRTAAPSEVMVDFRTQSWKDVADRVERCLGVRLDRESAVVKRRSVGSRTDRDTWVRIEARPCSKLTGQGVVWRADETELVIVPPIKPGGVLSVDPGLSRAWWATLGGSLGALAAQAMTRVATPHTVPISRDLATLGHRSEARHAATLAQRHMDTAGRDEPGRFGFDRAELHQHLAEAFLCLGDTSVARVHADRSLELKRPGSGGWAAATVILARVHAAERSTAEATALANSVLDTVLPALLRETTRRRLRALDVDLLSERQPGQASRDLHDRLLTLPAHIPARRASPEPNGQ